MHYNDKTIILEGQYRFTSLKNIPAAFLLKEEKKTKDMLLKEYIIDNYDLLVARDFFEDMQKRDTYDLTCAKVPYWDENEARAELFRIARRNQINRKPVRIYRCTCGAFHLTSKIFSSTYQE